MGSIRITEFGGMKPREHRGLGANSRASIARNAKLRSGALRPFRYPSLELETDKKICKLFQSECCFICSENPCANFTTGDTNCDRIFSTGVLDYPAYALHPDCSENCGELPELEWFRLGVPQPTGTPVVSNLTLTDNPADCTDCEVGFERSREMRAYSYTFVNSYGEEGQPSPISDIVDADYDSTATIGLSIPPLEDGYEEPVFIRIYRAGSGWSEEGEWEGSMSDFFHVDDIPYQEGNFTYEDLADNSCLGETCMSECYYPPLDCLQNITSTDDGVLVASEGKNLWFSEPWRFHAWSCHLNLDDCIEAIVVNGAFIYVATTGHPYVISIKNAEVDCTCCREVNKIQHPHPIACKKSMVKTHNGVMWASNTGLVQLSGGSLQIDTHDFMSEDDWQEWYPHDITGVYYKGMYLGFNSERGFIWDFNDGIYADSYPGESGKFTQLDITPYAAYVSKQNFLFLTFDGGIYRFDNSDTFMPYIWRSKLHVEGGLQNFSAMKIVFEKWLRTRKSPNPVIMRLYADGKLVFTRKVSCSRPFRLPKGYDALNWEIELQGIESIMEVHMATSMQELVLLNNA